MQQYPRVLAEMARVCKPGGYVVVFDIESPVDKVQKSKELKVYFNRKLQNT